ncbi:Uncharacterised protein [Vibrio cholerae]|nr:Uncharacterised protein [Vibrio cholerae]
MTLNSPSSTIKPSQFGLLPQTCSLRLSSIRYASIAVSQIGQRFLARSAAVSTSSSRTLITPSSSPKLMVVLQRSFGGNP